ncbi:MAG: hypothetical protein SNI49_03785 [Rikenellaceae bacterium]
MINKITALILAATSIVSCATPEKSSEVVISEGLRFNESTFPYNGTLLIANFGTVELNPLNSEGKGYIAQLIGDKISTFIPADGNLSAPKGMIVKDNYLVVCDVNKLVAYNLTNKSAAPQILTLPEGEIFANDIVSDGNNLFVSITNTGTIFKIDATDLSKFSEAQPVEWFNVIGANGMVYSNGAIFVVSYTSEPVATEANVIYKISNLDAPTLSIVSNQAERWDGLAISEDKTTLYASSWAPAQIVAIDIATGTTSVVPIETEFIGAADFTLMDGKLYIPDLPNSSVIIKEL